MLARANKKGGELIEAVRKASHSLGRRRSYGGVPNNQEKGAF